MDAWQRTAPRSKRTRARWLHSRVGEHRDSIPEGAGRPASRRTSSTVDVLALRQPSNGTVVTVGTMAKDETASKRSAEEIARARARFTINLQRAFNDLLPKLKRAYGQPTDDAAKMLLSMPTPCWQSPTF